MTGRISRTIEYCAAADCAALGYMEEFSLFARLLLLRYSFEAGTTLTNIKHPSSDAR